ncbi:hypothetical protein IL306_012226 [Fusarium sp. DS 682]|nr:hypothetical protein IL306_012226 [Fusarium sp. DS 682]
MDTNNSLCEPLEGIANQDDNAIERSLEWLLADINGTNGSLPANVEMDAETQQTAHGRTDARDEDKEEKVPQIEGDLSGIPMRSSPSYRFEVAIPEMPIEKRNEYSAVHSDIVEFTFGELPSDHGTISYHVEFTDGRQELVGG